MQFIDQLHVIFDTVVYFLSKCHCIRTAHVTESVIQCCKEPHLLDIEISRQREPYEFIESEFRVSFELITQLIALLHQRIYLIKKIERLVIVKCVINTVTHRLCAACGSDPRISSQEIADGALIGS